MRKTLRISLLLIKTVLLLIALAALALAHFSRGRALEALVQRHDLASDSHDRRWFWCTAWDGRVYFGWGAGRYFNPQLLARLREDPASTGHWTFKTNLYEHGWERVGSWPSQWWQLRWEILDTNNIMVQQRYRRFAAPLWLVAILAAAWPALSIALAVRRRVKRRRATREGRCTHCGYDLRATPQSPKEGGGVLAVCPECGTKTMSNALFN